MNEQKINLIGGNFKIRIKSMLKFDFKRTLISPLFYIMSGICLLMPVLIFVMTTMMDGTVSTDQAGNQVVIEGFKSVWQALGSVSGEGMAMSMDLTSMCNINMLYFLIAVFVCVFIAEDFKSGYAKNLFTVRSKKIDYVISKTMIGFFASAVMFICFFIGALIGGAVSGISFALESVNVGNVMACLLSKILLCLIFVSVYTLASVFAKQRSWLSILISLCVGMLFYTVAPMTTPLNSGFLNIILCLAGGVGFAVGIGALSNLVLKKTSTI